LFVKRGVHLYRGNDYHFRLHDYDKALAPQRISLETWKNIRHIIENVYFVGFPQIIKQPESEPKYKVKVEKDVMIPMRDGIKIAADIYRPETEGKFPTVLSFGSWGKDICETVMWLPPQQYQPDTPFWAGNLEAGPIQHLVERGYIVVVPDPRGWKLSGGEIDCFIDTMFNDWPRDIYDIIDWIIKQPWSNGVVGMMGECIYGAAQVLAAALCPHPALKAIAPWEFVGVLVSDINFTGVVHTMLYSILTNRHVNDSNAWPRYKLKPWTFKHLSKEDVERRLKELLDHPDIKYNARYYGVLQYPDMDPAGFMVDGLMLWLHPPPPNKKFPVSDEFPYNNINIPAYFNTPWNVAIYIWDTFHAYEKTGAKDKKLFISHPREMRRPWVDYWEELVRWFDYWLKGIDVGIIEEPPIKLFVTGINKWKFEKEWPPARAQFRRLYLHSKGHLSFERPSESSPPDTFTQHALYEDPAVYAMFYTSEPLKDEIEVIGPVELVLEAAIDKDFTNWIIDFVDISPRGEAQVISQGWLCTYFREIEETKSRPGRPRYKRKDAEPTPRNVKIRYRIALMPVAHVFQVGHRVQVIVRSQDDLLSIDGLIRDYILPRMETVTHTIYYGESALILPVMPKPKERIIITEGVVSHTL